MRITLLIEPSRDAAIPFAAGPERYQRLADELSRYAGTQVQIIKDVLQKAPDDSYVLFAGGGDVSRSLADCDAAHAARLAVRIVLLDVSWQRALAQLERHRLAGAVDSLRLSEWLARPSSCAGPFGLRNLAKPLEASCTPLPAFRSAHYCLLQSNHHRGMPHLLADYMAAYDRDQQPLSAVPSVSLTPVLRAPTEEAFGPPQTRAGRANGATSASQVESVTIKRAIDFLKRARASSQMTLLQVAERSGLDPEQLGLLEESDYSHATLGTLRAYFLALEPTLEWTLAATGAPIFPRPHSRREPVETTTNAPAISVPDGGNGVEAAHPLESSPAPAESRWIRVEHGMTVLGNRRSRRWPPEGELVMPTDRRPKEESDAGV